MNSINSFTMSIFGNDSISKNSKTETSVNNLLNKINNYERNAQKIKVRNNNNRKSNTNNLNKNKLTHNNIGRSNNHLIQKKTVIQLGDSISKKIFSVIFSPNTKLINNHKKKVKNKNACSQNKKGKKILKDNIKDNKIVGLDFIKIKRKKEIIETKKEEEKKSFTNQEVKDILQLIITLRNQIFEKRNKLNNININSEDKMHKFFAQNKTIEIELKEEIKTYKELLTRKNELKKLINKLNSKSTKQKIIKKQNSVKEINSINNNIDIDNLNSISNNNNDINSQIILNDKNNSEINLEKNELNISEKNNKENNEITLNNLDMNKNINQVNEEKIIKDNINEANEGFENKEIKVSEEQIIDNNKKENTDINDIKDINNNEIQNILQNENEQ